ncbi:MAG: hypothetical protein IH984_13330 [Planctomycetes bacterium]|nr:hypothetical protein [Planctomycetota bacterium]
MDDVVEEDPWAPLNLEPVPFKGGTLHLDPKLSDQRDAIKTVLESFVTELAENGNRHRIWKHKAHESIEHINQILGFEPDAEQVDEQRQLLNVFKGGVLPIELAPASRFRFYFGLAETNKAYLRRGGILPNFSYDPDTDKASYNFEVTSTLNDDGSLALAPVEWLAYVVDEPATAVDKLREFLSSFQAVIGQSRLGVIILTKSTIIKIIRPADALSRWFSEGFTYAITLEVMKRLGEDKAASDFAAFFNTKDYADLEHNINLRYWPADNFAFERQRNWKPVADTPFGREKQLKGARSVFATYEAQRLIEHHGIGCVKEILDHLRDMAQVRSEDLITAIRDATGEDMNERLRQYQQFETVDDGMDVYQVEYLQASKRGDSEAAFYNLVRLIELRLVFENLTVLQLYPRAAELLCKMGDQEAGQVMLQKAINLSQRLGPGPQLQLQMSIVKHALAFDDLTIFHDMAEELLQKQPGFAPALLVRVHRLKHEDKVQEASDLAQQLLDSVVFTSEQHNALRRIIE